MKITFQNIFCEEEIKDRIQPKVPVCSAGCNVTRADRIAVLRSRVIANLFGDHLRRTREQLHLLRGSCDRNINNELTKRTGTPLGAQHAAK
jgi:hypothetical protein